MNSGGAAPARISQAILRGEWHPGERLAPATLAKKFESSTTVVREALAQLAGGPLVTFVHNRGFFVSNLSLDELRDTTTLRSAVEEIGLRMSMERGGLQWESEVVAAHHRLAHTPRRTPEDPRHTAEAWSTAHKEFHASLLKGSGFTALSKIAAQLADSTELYRCWAAAVITTPRDVEGEHAAIVDAISNKDADLAVKLLKEHYERTLDEILVAGLVTA